MDELIIRYLQRVASEAEADALQAWRQAAPENDERYHELARLWEVSARATPATTHRSAPNADALIRRAESPAQRLTPSPVRRRKTGWARLTTRTVAAAALVILGIGIGDLVWPGRGGSINDTAEIMTTEDDLATIRLGDGSVVRLAPSSRLRVIGSLTDRQVWLDGRAFFAIAEQQAPFRVQSQAGDVLVLGTRFELRTEEGRLRVAVFEGQVDVSAGKDTVNVGPGQMLMSTGASPPTLTELGDPRGILGWMGEFVVFQSTPLEQVARELEQHYGVRIRIEGTDIAQRTISALFTDESFDDVLMMICRVANVKCSIAGEAVTIEP